MAEYKRPISQEDFKKNFKQKKPLMNETEAYFESARCLFCYEAPCIQACPTHIDIPLFIKQIHTKNTEGSAKTIFESNWLGNACGIVCPTGVLCEGACVYNHQNVLPVQIGRLQNFATNHLITSGKKIVEPGKDQGKKVAIIGAGPAGIACACELRVFGYDVHIFEAKSKPSGLTVNGIAPYKISNEEVLNEIAYLQHQLGFKINYNSAISSKEQLLKLEKEYDAIFLGVGLGETAALKIDGEDKKGVTGAVEFVEELRDKQHKITVPNTIVVLGGGNTAMDAASESARMGAKKVILAYRRRKESMGAYTFEYDLAISSGVTSLFNVTPKAIIGNSHVEGVKFVRTEYVDGGIQQVKDSEFVVACDMVIKATGQAKKGSLYELIDGLKIDQNTKIEVNKDSCQTTNKKYFAGGDAVNGGAEVVNAAFEGKMAAQGIHNWLK
jgi:glutamate synthase (NADPH/NADH) small chain